MAMMKIEKSAWHSYFDLLSKTLDGKQAEIEIASLSFGNQIESEWVPFMGIVYEPRSDIIEIVLEGLDHMIQKPQEVYADYGPSGLASLEIIDDGDVRQIVKLRDPLMLPSPPHA